MAYVARRPEDDQYSSVSQNLQAQNRAQQGQVEKTQAQGNAPAGSANPGSSKAPGDFTKSNFSNATDILNRNKNADISSVTKRLLGNTEKNAEAQNKQIADKVNQYKTDTTGQIQSQYAAPDSSTLDNALKGDSAAENKISSRLGMEAAPVKEIDLGNRYEIAPTEFYKSNEYQPLLQQRSKDAYTSGMGALDSSLFNRSGGSQDVRNTVGRLQSGVDAAREQATGATGQMNDYAKQYENEQENVLRNLLSGKVSSIQSDIASRIPAAQQNAMNLIESQKGQLASQQKSAAQKALDDFNKQVELAKQYGTYDYYTRGQDGNDLDKYRNEFNFDPNKYLSYDNPNLTAADLTTQQDADMMNKLYGWLGSSDVAQAGKNVNPQVKFDENAFNDWLKGVSTGGLAGQLKMSNDQKAAQIRAEQLKKAIEEENARKATQAVTGGSGGATGSVNIPKKNNDNIIETGFKKLKKLFG